MDNDDKARRYDAILAIFWDDDAHDWREIDSGADAIQDVCLILDEPTPEPDKPQIVYALFHETNSGKFDESDGYIEALYATEAAAEAAKLAAIREAIDEGKDVWWNPDEPDAEGPSYWSDDWRVEAHQVLQGE